MERFIAIKDVPSNEIVEMTPELYQEFCLGGCVPMCHLTLEPIKMGEKFKLCTTGVAVRSGSLDWNKIETQEVMLSENASVEEFEKIQNDRYYNYEKRRKQGGGCFRVNGKIIT